MLKFQRFARRLDHTFPVRCHGLLYLVLYAYSPSFFTNLATIECSCTFLWHFLVVLSYNPKALFYLLVYTVLRRVYEFDQEYHIKLFSSFHSFFLQRLNSRHHGHGITWFSLSRRRLRLCWLSNRFSACSRAQLLRIRSEPQSQPLTHQRCYLPLVRYY